MTPRRQLLALAVATMLAPSWGAGLAAQERPRAVLPELRIDAKSADVTAAHVAAGLHLVTGTYARLALIAGAGQWWSNGDTGASYRLEAQLRFHLDPFRTSRFGLYGLGGVMTTKNWRLDPQSNLIAGAGVELPAHARTTWAVEAALAGGFRLSVVTRRVALGRR